MLAQYLDVTDIFNANGEAIVEASNYDYCLIQIINSTGDTIYLKSTIDSGAVQSVTDGNALLSTNYVDVAFTDLSNGSLNTGGLGDGIYRLNVVGRYVKILCPIGTPAVSKLLVMLTKIS